MYHYRRELLFVCLPNIFSSFCGNNTKSSPICSGLDFSTQHFFSTLGWPHYPGWPGDGHVTQTNSGNKNLH